MFHPPVSPPDIFECLRTGDIQEFRQNLRRNSFSTSTFDTNLNTPLHYASFYGQHKFLMKLLDLFSESPIDFTQRNVFGQTILAVAKSPHWTVPDQISELCTTIIENNIGISFFLYHYLDPKDLGVSKKLEQLISMVHSSTSSQDSHEDEYDPTSETNSTLSSKSNERTTLSRRGSESKKKSTDSISSTDSFGFGSGFELENAFTLDIGSLTNKFVEIISPRLSMFGISNYMIKPDSVPKFEKPPLTHSISHGHSSQVQSEFRQFSIVQQAKSKRAKKAKKRLLSKLLAPDPFSSWSLFHASAYNGYPDMFYMITSFFEAFLDDPDIPSIRLLLWLPDQTGNYPLHIAIFKGHAEFVSILADFWKDIMTADITEFSESEIRDSGLFEELVYFCTFWTKPNDTGAAPLDLAENCHWSALDSEQKRIISIVKDMIFEQRCFLATLYEIYQNDPLLLSTSRVLEHSSISCPPSSVSHCIQRVDPFALSASRGLVSSSNSFEFNSSTNWDDSSNTSFSNTSFSTTPTSITIDSDLVFQISLAGKMIMAAAHNRTSTFRRLAAKFTALGLAREELFTVKKSVLLETDSRKYYTCLHWAALHGNVDIISSLYSLVGMTVLAHSVLKARDSVGHTPLHVAAFYGQSDALKLLLSWYSFETNQSFTVYSSSLLPLSKLFDKNGATVYTLAFNPHYTVPEYVCDQLCYEVQQFLKQGPNSEHLKLFTDPFPMSSVANQFKTQTAMPTLPLHQMTKDKDLDMLSVTVSTVNPKFCRDGNSQTPLHLACISGDFEVAKLLLDNSFELVINTRDHQGFTPLMYVCFYHYKNILDYMLQKCGFFIDLDICTVGGANALSLARNPHWSVQFAKEIDDSFESKSTQPKNQIVKALLGFMGASKNVYNQRHDSDDGGDDGGGEPDYLDETEPRDYFKARYKDTPQSTVDEMLCSNLWLRSSGGIAIIPFNITPEEARKAYPKNPEEEDEYTIDSDEESDSLVISRTKSGRRGPRISSFYDMDLSAHMGTITLTSRPLGRIGSSTYHGSAQKKSTMVTWVNSIRIVLSESPIEWDLLTPSEKGRYFTSDMSGRSILQDAEIGGDDSTSEYLKNRQDTLRRQSETSELKKSLQEADDDASKSASDNQQLAGHSPSIRVTSKNSSPDSIPLGKGTSGIFRKAPTSDTESDTSSPESPTSSLSSGPKTAKSSISPDSDSSAPSPSRHRGPSGFAAIFQTIKSGVKPKHTHTHKTQPTALQPHKPRAKHGGKTRVTFGRKKKPQMPQHKTETGSILEETRDGYYFTPEDDDGSGKPKQFTSAEELKSAVQSASSS